MEASEKKAEAAQRQQVGYEVPYTDEDPRRKSPESELSLENTALLEEAAGRYKETRDNT